MEEEIQQAERLHERVETVRQLKAELDTLRRRVVREAQAATRALVAEAYEVKDLWSSAVESLRAGLSVEEQIMVLQVFMELTTSGQHFRDAVRRQWALVERIGGNAKGAEELVDAGRLLDRVHTEARRALEVRKTPWLPADPARLEKGREEIRQGKAIHPDEARARFRKKAE